MRLPCGGCGYDVWGRWGRQVRETAIQQVPERTVEPTVSSRFQISECLLVNISNVIRLIIENVMTFIKSARGPKRPSPIIRAGLPSAVRRMPVHVQW
jgi:hypothetical protein